MDNHLLIVLCIKFCVAIYLSLFLQENCLISRFQNIRINFVIIQTTAKLSLSFKIVLSFPLYTTFVYRSITHAWYVNLYSKDDQ